MNKQNDSCTTTYSFHTITDTCTTLNVLTFRVSVVVLVTGITVTKTATNTQRVTPLVHAATDTAYIGLHAQGD